MPLESTITQSIIKYINSLPYGIAEKVQGSAVSSGRPDINGCYKGYCLRLEIKSPDHGNKASAKQLHSLQKWENAEAVVGVLHSLDDAKHLIQGIEYTITTGLLQYYNNETSGTWWSIPGV